eukprot:GDKI01006603.1.p3 GENE.GDKI01006603.1~~GDKI01006603.1.p3  ORF type:complete len:105 (+),score=47.01 GDKI01006603.1:1-315(+)
MGSPVCVVPPAPQQTWVLNQGVPMFTPPVVCVNPLALYNPHLPLPLFVDAQQAALANTLVAFQRIAALSALINANTPPTQQHQQQQQQGGAAGEPCGHVQPSAQ